jgi:hypothetical protein
MNGSEGWGLMIERKTRGGIVGCYKNFKNFYNKYITNKNV